jgi:hypothetical protein
MGFKLGFADNTTTTFTNQGASTKTETVATNTVTLNEYSDVSNVTGTVTPTLAWGTSLAMNGMTVLPHAQLSLGFYTNKDNYKRSQITTVAGTETSNVQTTNADDTGYFNPGIALGADVIFAENNGVKMSAGFTYNGTFRIYGNKNGLTQYIDSDITVAGVRIESITDNKPSPKMSGSVNNFTPSFAMGKDWDRLSLGFNVALPFGFDSTSTTANSVNMTDAKTTTNNVFTGRTVTTTTTEGLSAATNTTFTFVPRLNMGFRYKVGEDDRWTINGGFGVKFPDANVLTAKPTTQTKTVVKQDVYVTEGGSPTTTTTTTMTPAVTESTTTTTTWNPMTADLNGGLTFNFTENFYLDGNFNIAALNFSVFGLLTTNMNLQFVVKF